MKVFFIGAGPGDPDLLTIKARRIIGEAPVVVYAGSLINPEIIKMRKPEAELHDSSALTMEEIEAVFSHASERGLDVARLHSGDPCLYGTLQEQLVICQRLGVAFAIVPGVSSMMAAAAAIERELTLPGASQTVIVTRLGGRTPVPEGEALELLAERGATMVIFLSAHRLVEVAERLMFQYDPQTPAAVVAKASWPEQTVVQGTLADISEKAEQAGIKKTAIIVVGEVLAGTGDRSYLYKPGFSHSHRELR